ncbi:MAG: restriction endonuclease subunit S [wastewater metagenome]|nr:restriction endonuclease subunit S [Candidatus Loosdrechtia aerotolerans]
MKRLLQQNLSGLAGYWREEQRSKRKENKAMSKVWPMVPLGDILTKSNEWIDINPEKQYRQVTVRLWGKGVVLRGVVSGVEIASSKRLVVKPQQFILSRIDARNGAFGLIPDSLDGAVVSSDFPVFTINTLRILPKFLDWMSKTHFFVDLCKAASEGTTNRVRLKEERFLTTKISLPSLSEQYRIIVRIEELTSKIEKAKTINRLIENELRHTLLSIFSKLIDKAEFQLMKKVGPITRRPIEITIDSKYPELGIRSFGKGTFHKPELSGLEVGTKRLYKIETGDFLDAKPFFDIIRWLLII